MNPFARCRIPLSQSPSRSRNFSQVAQEPDEGWSAGLKCASNRLFWKDATALADTSPFYSIASEKPMVDHRYLLKAYSMENTNY